jgi:lysophospholipase L1-like esterase
MRLRLATSALLGFGLLLTCVLPVAAKPDNTSEYLALGDSVAFGYREGLPAQAYLNPDSFLGYPERLAPLLGLQLTNAACPGETSSSFISSTAPDNGCREYRSFFPLHTTYTGTQLAFALAFLRSHPDTRLVTIDVGANDLFLLQSACAGASACERQQLPGLLKTVATNLDTIYDQLRGEAGYHGRLVALTYYARNYRDTLQLEAVGTLDLVIASETLAHGGQVADGFSAFALASLRTGGDACAAGLLNWLPTGGCDVHPSSAGADLLAHTIRAVMRP